jgi:TolB-like protein
VAIVLLSIGLIVITATAWVQTASASALRPDLPEPWEVDLRDVKDSIARGRMPHLTWSRSILGGMVAFSLLFGAAGLYVLLRDGGRSLAPRNAIARAAPAVAVMPFSVRGTDVSQWREGMVDLLSANLDGVAGLRAIDSRTVLARWRDVVGEETAPPNVALRAAHLTGARYGIVGQAVSSGRQLRLDADVYRLADGHRLGHVQVEGSEENVFQLVDRLSIDIIRSLIGQRDARHHGVDITAITTSSLPALRAYLEGESLLRRSEFPAASRKFQQAVEADSTFALAWYRLGTASGWTDPAVGLETPELLARAARMADRLPPREAVLLKAELGYWRSSLEGLELLRHAVRTHPDDAEAWYLLGETYYHSQGAALVDPMESDRAFAKAIHLDPEFGPAHIHYVQNAFLVHADSQEAARRIAAYTRFAPMTEYARQFRLASNVAFGDSAAQASAIQIFDSLPIRMVNAIIFDTLRHPRFADQLNRLCRRLILRTDADPSTWYILYWSDAVRGRLQRATATAADPEAPTWLKVAPHESRAQGLHVPERDLESLSAQPDTALPEIEFYAGVHAVDRGDPNGLARALAALRSRAATYWSEADSTQARSLEAMASGAEAYAAWKGGDTDRALMGLEAALPRLQFGSSSNAVRWWLAEVNAQVGRPEAALRYYASVWTWPPADLRRARIHASLGEQRLARAEYEALLRAWSQSDPELQPFVLEARAALHRLGTTGADP